MIDKKYRRYFLFIFRNWNLRLALFTLRHELRGEKKYRISSTGFDNLSTLDVRSDNKTAAYIYQPVNYFMAEKAFDYLKTLDARGGLVDFGCGMGRLLAIAAYYGYTKITGVEFAPALCREAEENVKAISSIYPKVRAHIFCEDATRYEVAADDCVFTFFNPFDDRVMLPVVKNILKSCREHPRDVFVVYFNPTEKDIWLSAGFSEIWYYSKMNYLDLSVLYKPAESEGD